ncbi:MAG: hypothetical protein RLO04_04700 [Limnobacter sp.]|uniref:hypothetical protein n=1 Tax=Limnobacter sp. TaxID=2003368 RepID=UPI0032EC54BE
MSTTKFFAVTILAASISACGGGGGGDSAGGSVGQPSAPVELSEYRVDSGDRLFLNRNNADEIAAIILKEFSIQALGASTKGLGTVYDGPLVADSQTIGISHTLVRAFEFLEANYPNNFFSSPNCGQTPLSIVTTDENNTNDYDSGDSIDLGGCSSTDLVYNGGYGVDDLVLVGSASPNSQYSITGTFRIAGWTVSNDVDQAIQTGESGQISITGSSSNQKTLVFNGTFGADYNSIVNGALERFAGSSHQNRQIQAVYTPGSDYQVTGQYDFFGNFDNVFNRPGTGFRMDVRDLNLSGRADGSISDGSFRVLGADNTSLLFTVRNDGTLVFGADEDGNGSVDFQSGSIDVSSTVQKFSF